MRAVRRTDVDELNLRALVHMAASGRLDGPVLTVAVSPYAERSFAAGDSRAAEPKRSPSTWAIEPSRT